VNFCVYYKPGKKEELACRGHQVVERLMREGRQLTFERSGSQCDAERSELIVRKVCSGCGFREDGCDFILDRTAPPCGGFALLSQLAAEGIIRISDL
jgi:hypothetical protein